jgi:hypothetical protein
MPLAIFTSGLDGASDSFVFGCLRKSGGPVAWGGSASVRVVAESFRKGGFLRVSFRPRVIL